MTSLLKSHVCQFLYTFVGHIIRDILLETFLETHFRDGLGKKNEAIYIFYHKELSLLT